MKNFILLGLLVAILACNVWAEEETENEKNEEAVDEKSRQFGGFGGSSHHSSFGNSHSSFTKQLTITKGVSHSSGFSSGHSSFHGGGFGRPGFGRPGFGRPGFGRFRSYEEPEAPSYSAGSSYSAPPCPTNYLFSCSPHVAPVPCAQGY